MDAEHLIDCVVSEGASPSDALTSLVEVDKHAADELELYIDNTYSLYKEKEGTYAKNAIAKVARGVYDSAQAAKLFLYLVDRAAQQYNKEHGSSGPYRGGSSFGIFDKGTRMAVAKELVKSFEDSARRGEYEALLPKKYQGTLTYPLKSL